MSIVIKNNKLNDLLSGVLHDSCGSYPCKSILKEVQERADKEGWIDAEDLERELGVLD